MRKTPQLIEEDRQLMRKSRKSAADEAGQKGGRLLLHLGPGVRQAIEGDEVYFLECGGFGGGGDDWEVTLDPPVNVVLPVSRSGLAALWAAFGED